MVNKPLAALLVLLATAFPASAAGSVADVRDTIEASLLVTGTIEVDPHGRVESFGIDQREKLPAHVQSLLDRAVPAWRFDPTVVDGQAAWVRTPMRLRLVASKVADVEDAVALRIANASFGEPSEFADNRTRVNHPPRYPGAALRVGASGSVYLVLKVDFEGRVLDALAEQVNLRYLGNEREMDRLRRMFARAAERASLQWRFRPPEKSPGDTGTFWSARVPVDFKIGNAGEPPYGVWASYVPGPRQMAPWLAPEHAAGGDAFLAGGVYPVGTGLRLLTPLEGKG